VALKKIDIQTFDAFMLYGCMRCKWGDTPQCKVNTWRDALLTLREIAAKSGLVEEIKWGFPTYTQKGKNVLIIGAFKEFVSLSFFKGSLLNDSHNLLVKQGENSNVAKILKFTSVDEILVIQDVIQAYIQEAILIEETGVKVEKVVKKEPIPEELEWKFKSNPEFEAAFISLTLGRQRAYLIYFSQPKNSETRIKRIENYTSKILQGIGFHDDYKSNQKS
jgi:uncharacterized protein YdeI (YjbR/CyaY-like superfamily)